MKQPLFRLNYFEFNFQLQIHETREFLAAVKMVMMFFGRYVSEEHSASIFRIEYAFETTISTYTSARSLTQKTNSNKEEILKEPCKYLGKKS